MCQLIEFEHGFIFLSWRRLTIASHCLQWSWWYLQSQLLHVLVKSCIPSQCHVKNHHDFLDVSICDHVSLIRKIKFISIWFVMCPIDCTNFIPANKIYQLKNTRNMLCLTSNEVKFSSTNNMFSIESS